MPWLNKAATYQITVWTSVVIGKGYQIYRTDSTCVVKKWNSRTYIDLRDISWSQLIFGDAKTILLLLPHHHESCQLVTITTETAFFTMVCTSIYWKRLKFWKIKHIQPSKFNLDNPPSICFCPYSCPLTNQYSVIMYPLIKQV